MSASMRTAFILPPYSPSLPPPSRQVLGKNGSPCVGDLPRVLPVESHVGIYVNLCNVANKELQVFCLSI
jgi:hypothetical protein